MLTENILDLRECRLCPRECGVDRRIRPGACRMTDQVMAARAALHYWEEPCISGEEGSGAVFFTGCALGCVYCQNRNIAAGKNGRPVSVERLAEIFIELQDSRANNINLVTAGHFIPQVIKAVSKARDKGLAIPVVYNSSGYEKPEAIRALAGTVDIFLPDFKYMYSETAARYSRAADYPQAAAAALEQMVKQAGKAEFDQRGLMRKGIIVRHLVLPGCVEESKAVIKYLYDTYGDDIYISIMNQYTPMPGIEKEYCELGRKITDEEYDEVVDYAIDIGVENGFIQEGETAQDSFIPEFDNSGI